MSDPRRRRPTMLDVAAKAGVSRASVSLAFRGEPGVGDETRQRIFDVATEIGYVRDEGARGLRAANPTNVGVCFDTRQPFQLELVDGLYRAMADSMSQLVLSGRSEDRSEREAIDSLVAFRSGVLVLISSLMSESKLVELAQRVPVISVGRQVRASEIPWVASDDLAGMTAAVGHLKDLGHRDVIYLSSPTAPAGRDRERAFRSAAATHGLEDQVRIMHGGMTEHAGAVVAEELLGADRLPTAIIGFNDRCALGLLEVFLRRGIKVPDDVSIVGIDDSEIASRTSVSMTSIRQDPARLAQLAFERAQDLLDGAVGRSVPRGTLVPTSLTIRETTAPAR
ncbi:MAG: LacI family DNA-binding transcriptional regulator [Tessaracoccus sp.]|uniref:LacI family DNA-binding transcriptional regulator n=1 Tax=Tessaracoccus sp. TaxID=1971211 RepID=UPI001EB6CFD5|nr:LacI family DNA-binding transcriptional regulator [Tessaracoccus sp.]MBK7819773.1 LacI family DNA-binding transcriptional regulator [Tessaracoccus sp.]